MMLRPCRDPMLCAQRGVLWQVCLLYSLGFVHDAWMPPVRPTQALSECTRRMLGQTGCAMAGFILQTLHAELHTGAL